MWIETVSIIVWYCLHYVVLYSQNKELYDACDDGDVSKAKELIDRGAHVNYHNPDINSKVSIVSGHMTWCVLVTDPHISIYYHTQSVVEYLVPYVC